jgi:hypothetical protein
MGNIPRDPESEAAMEVVLMDAKKETALALARETREALIAKTHEMIGRIQTADMFGKMATVASIVWLRDVRDSGIYKDITGVGTWDTFCGYLGKTSRHINEQINNLNTFGEDFLKATEKFKLGYRDLKKLRLLTHEGAVSVSGGAVAIAGELIPMDPDHSEDLEAALEKVLEEKDKALADARAAVKAKERVLEAKEGVILKMEKEIQAMAGKTPSLPEEEAAVLKKAEAFKTAVNALLLQMDPENQPENTGPAARAAIAEALGYAARRAVWTHRAALDIYGEPDADFAGFAGEPDASNTVFPEDLPPVTDPEDAFLDRDSVKQILRNTRDRAQKGQPREHGMDQ